MWVIKIECDLQLPHLALQESQFLLPQKVLEVLQVVYHHAQEVGL